MDEHEKFRTPKIIFCSYFQMNSVEDLKKVWVYQHIMLFSFRGKTTPDNEWLTREATRDEIQQAGKWISTLKALDQTVCMQIFIKNTSI